jgi:hypothetical protein
MLAILKPHPDWPCPAVERIAVEIARPAQDVISIRYEVSGRIAELRVPPMRSPVRTEELWRTTCFEAFLRPQGGEGYLEFNFAPSGEWAAYAFSAYREGMQRLDPLAVPAILTSSQPDRLIVDVSLSLSGLADGPWRAGLSAVIEGRDGTKAYWAVTHPPGKADFHHRDCFALDLPEAQSP